MTKGRLEAFTDGVLAIVITIMVLELNVPAGNGLDALRPVLPGFVAAALMWIVPDQRIASQLGRGYYFGH